MKKTCDVCIFGAGPAGTATGARLADLGLACIVLDRPSAKRRWGGESFSGAIREPLAALGLWEGFCSAGHVAGYEQRTTWGAPQWTKDSIFSHYGHFWHVDRERFDNDLRCAVTSRGIPIYIYQSLQTLRQQGAQGEGWYLCLGQDCEIYARYLVDATGRACAVARRLGVRPRLFDHLIAFAALVPHNQNSNFDHAMVIESMPQGWWYTAPVPRGHVLAFFTDADLAPQQLARSMKTAAAHSAFTQPENGKGWIPVGDACSAHDPLCGWGVFRAMSNGLRAADAIATYLKTQDDARLKSYVELCGKQFREYLEGLTRHYSFEQRWANSPFWQRRMNLTFSLA